ncbi:ATP-binding cassette domain-containing protein [Puniceicoccus vermicola]|uniref:ATP-binding cassette domain-containing protein n=1 Tax=Puniceicoccus vermicola TaxID=388746 RepID=A0A7X1E5V6_9BACT|nr:ATP-binding cassette domain-containing protein [Puniceicoccus vermicola]
MRIQLQRVEPDYLAKSTLESSDVWGKQIQIEAPDGVILWGPSGQGKSTFFRILFGLERRYRGDLVIDGLPPSERPHRVWPEVRAERLAFVAQHFHLFEEKTGRENLEYLPRRAPGVKEEDLNQWADYLGIAAILDRPPSTWSQGQQQRFCILRALASPFEFILLDEPVSHLDPDSAERSLKLIRTVCSERKAGWIISQQTAIPPFPAQQILRV